jgi:hypothetical protein
MHNIKAAEITKAKSINMVRMQAWWLSHDYELLGSIGSMMKGSGLEEAL